MEYETILAALNRAQRMANRCGRDFYITFSRSRGFVVSAIKPDRVLETVSPVREVWFA